MGNNNKNSPLTDKHTQRKIYVENNKHWNPPGLRKQEVFVPILCLLLSEWVRSVNEWVGDWAACWEVTFSNFVSTISPPYHLFSDFLSYPGALLEGLGFWRMCCGAKLQLWSSWRVGMLWSYMVEECGSAVEHTPLRAAWNWFLRWTLYWWPSWTERGRKTGRKSRFQMFGWPSGIKRKCYLSVDTQPSIQPLIHNRGNPTLNFLTVRQLCLRLPLPWTML